MKKEIRLLDTQVKEIIVNGVSVRVSVSIFEYGLYVCSWLDERFIKHFRSPEFSFIVKHEEIVPITNLNGTLPDEYVEDIWEQI